MNLLKETLKVLKEHNKTWQDVRFISNYDGEIPLGRFKTIADQIYDESYGFTEVRDDLVIVGDDWWLDRRDYDGAEWWEFNHMPDKPDTVDYTWCVFKDQDKNERY